MNQLRKLLVANRGEIAIRVFRSSTELGASTVAIYSHEDRFSLHRYKADEAYQVGVPGQPVQSYLDIATIVRIAAEAEVDAIHPGYGFLSEREGFATACEAAGIVFVGPRPDTLRIAGDKVRTKELAQAQNVPTLPGSPELKSIEQALSEAEKIGYPVLVKASHGGGGRGMRMARAADELKHAFEDASSEALLAFGRGEVFLEKLVVRPKHVEVQLLGDGLGNVVHLYERDCSIQRRNQKVIECAPALALAPATREKLQSYAVTLGRALKLRSAATVEFLVSESEEIFFIEINPRIQVEHTVTEEITGIDIVRAQLDIATGKSLSDLDLAQEQIRAMGTAIQCRITTENPAKDFAPDYGKLLAYRSASGFGIRLDAGSAFTGAEITPYYDSMLVKVTARGRTLPEASSRLRRALSEFRIRGVSTNIPFLENVLQHPVFLAGTQRTSFLEEYSEVFTLPKRQDRANRLLRFLADTVVNGHELMPGLKRPAVLREAAVPKFELRKGPGVRSTELIPAGWRDKLTSLGKKEFLNAVRDEERLLITDTTFRDAHQSLCATRLRAFDMLRVADQLAIAAPGLFSLEMWGGATFDVAYRFLKEDPWDRVVQLRQRIPNILFQMLLRGDNILGYSTYPREVVRAFVEESVEAGIDLFRIFDSLNNLSRMRDALDAVQASGKLAEGCICFTGDLLSEELKHGRGELSKYDLKYYVSLAKELEKSGADIIGIKDMAGLLRPYAAQVLVKALRDEVSLPIHFHTHDTSGVQAAAYLKAAEVGVDIVDCAFASMSGVTSQPCLEGVVASLEHTPRDTGLILRNLEPFSAYWEAVRGWYAPFESDLKTPTGEVYRTEMPGGQYSNWRSQTEQLGLGSKWLELKDAYAAVNEMLGGIIKVTPSSKVVGDFAVFMVSNELSPKDVLTRGAELNFPPSVIEFFQGDLGEPVGGFPVALKQAVLGKAVDTVPTRKTIDWTQSAQEVEKICGRAPSRREILSYLLFPKVFTDFIHDEALYGDLALVPTIPFFYGLEEGEEIFVDIDTGKRLYISLVAVGDCDEAGERVVFFELNGQPRNINIRDKRVSPGGPKRERADKDNPQHVGAPLAGVVSAVSVKVGSVVKVGEVLCTLEAMKMQTQIRALREGTVARVLLHNGSRVAVGDLIFEIQ